MGKTEQPYRIATRVPLPAQRTTATGKQLPERDTAPVGLTDTFWVRIAAITPELTTTVAVSEPLPTTGYTILSPGALLLDFAVFIYYSFFGGSLPLA